MNGIAVFHFVQQQEDFLPFQDSPEDNTELISADPKNLCAFRQAGLDIFPGFNQDAVPFFPAEILVDVVKPVAVNQGDGYHFPVRFRVRVQNAVQFLVKRVSRRKTQRVIDGGNLLFRVNSAQFLVFLHSKRPFCFCALLFHCHMLLSVIFLIYYF